MNKLTIVIIFIGFTCGESCKGLSSVAKAAKYGAKGLRYADYGITAGSIGFSGKDVNY